MNVQPIRSIPRTPWYHRSAFFIILLIFQLAGLSASAQTQKVEGTVLDSSGAPLVGVTVGVKGGSALTASDGKGKFSINATIGATLTFSYTGYLDREEKVVSAAKMTVTLFENPASLDNVVVVGYGSQRKVNLTGAVAQISGKELANRPVPNVTAALQGLLPGVTVLRGSGKPGGEGLGIRIRGFSSANDASALVLVDGIEQDLNLLDPNDIESISVLKDASAAIYGARAAAGVILVTTKQGSAGKTRVTLNSYYGINMTARQPERLNSWDEQTLIDEARFNATGTREFNDEQYEWLRNPNFSYRPNPGSDRWEYFGNNNWIKEGMDKINGMQNHTLSVSGGEKNTNYLLSTSYYKRDGVLRYGPDDNSRYNIKLNVNTEINKYISLKLNTGYIGSFVNENSFGTDQIINRLYRSRTRQNLYTPEEDVTGQPYNGDLQINAVDIEKNAGLETRNFETFTGRVNLQVKNVVKGLTLDLIAWRNQNTYTMENNSRSLFWYGRSINTIRFQINAPNTMSMVKNRAYQNNAQAFLTYKFKLGSDHSFTIMQAGQFDEYRKDELQANAQSMINNTFFSMNFADPLTKTTRDLVQTWAMASLIGRLNYSYKDRYLFEAVYRYDGSSRLAPQNRWQLFPTFSAGWRISQESFMKNVNFINNAKLRVGWGQVGNGSVLGLYDYIPLLNSGITGTNNLLFNGVRTQYIYQSALASPQKTWETVENSNIGIDLNMFNNRLAVTADYFVKRNKNMLARLNLPNLIGVDVPPLNVGELKSWGWELDIKWKDRIGRVDYRIGFNISDNQNKLVKYDGTNSIGAGGVIGLLEGYPLNSVWGYRTGGYFPSAQAANDYKASVQYPFFANYTAGDMKYLDLNGDGVISGGEGTPTKPGDLVYLGTTNARFTYGLDFGFSWNRFDFSALFQGVFARKFLINEGTLSPILGTADMPWTIHMDRWTPDNLNSFFPRMYQTSAHNFRPSDRWAQDGSYIRLKNLQIGYSVPFKKFIKDMRIYVSGQDLWESTKVLSVFDPEVGNNVGATAYPFYRTVAFGVNVSF